MLHIGIPYELCGTLNPRLLKPFIEAKSKSEKDIDRRNWMLGSYVCEAVGVVVSNAFSKKSSVKTKYRDKPYYMEKEDNDIATGKIELTEEERALRVKKIFEGINASLMAKSPEVRKDIN